MSGVWTIEVGGTSRNYIDTDFERRLERTRPIYFSAIIKYASDIDYFDLVEIKRDGTVEWKGFIEDYNLNWDENGLYLDIKGRNTSILLWKKWSESFSNLHDDTKGFFGSVCATELIKFLLRNPNSDSPSSYPLNKEGWGMDRSRIGNCSAKRTASGDPNWVKSRRRGYGWKNKGTQFNSEASDVDANISHEWNDSGAGDNPWIEDLDDATYIVSNTEDEEDVFSFENLSTLDANATGINRVDIAVRWKPRQSFWGWEISKCEIWLSPDGTNYHYVGRFGGHTSPLDANPFKTYIFRTTGIITTVAQADAARVKFINKANHNIFISWCYLAINYSASGDQETDDYFDIPFDYDEIMGIYIESRFDDDSYPRNYRIYKVADIAADYQHASWTEEDPNSHITIDSGTEISFDAYMDETAYHSLDSGEAGFFGEFFKHTLKLIINTDPVPEPAAGGDEEGMILGIWGVTNTEDDLYSLYSDSDDFLALVVFRDPNNVYIGGAPCFALVECDGGSIQMDKSVELTEGSEYEFEVKREEDSLIVSITEDGDEFDILSLTLTAPSNTFRYLFGCVTSDTSTASNCDVDISNLVTEVETALIDEVTSNTYRDIIHSWDPSEMANIRIRITSQTSGKSWAISQIYVYPSTLPEFRTYRDSEWDTTLSDDASSGQADIEVTSASGFSAGDIVTIYDGNHQEVNRISSIVGTTITMVNNLEYTYETAENATLLKGFPSEQYIHALSFDTEYSTAIGSLNLPRGRLIDQINTIMEKCESSYVPYEWWLALDSNNTFHMDSQRGSDISASVSFVKGVNLGGAKKVNNIEDTVQRLRVLGQGEGKRQEDIASDWAEDKTNMVEINTFMEEVISDKSVVDSDIADIIANVKLTDIASPNSQITLHITNDPYDSMDYDVGDTITVVDSLLDVDSTYKIYNINKKISKDGENITIVVNAPYRDEKDEWHDLYKRLKMIEINEATAGDWIGEPEKDKIDVEKVTTSFEKEAKNDTIEEPKGVRDPKWYYGTNPDDYVGPIDHKVGAGTAVAEYYHWNIALNGARFYHTNEKMKVGGPTSGSGVQILEIEMRGESGDEIDIPITNNPKLVAELKFVKDSGAGTPEDWREGDLFEIGMYNLTTDIGYKIRFTKDAGNTLTAVAVWNEDGSNEETNTITTVNMSDINLSENYRYKIEIIIDSDEGIVFFNIYDLSISPLQEYPSSVLRLNIDKENTLRPLYLNMSADNNSTAGNIAKVNIYHFKAEWERIQ